MWHWHKKWWKKVKKWTRYCLFVIAKRYKYNQCDKHTYYLCKWQTDTCQPCSTPGPQSSVRHVTSPQTCTSYRQCWRVINVHLKWRHLTLPKTYTSYHQCWRVINVHSKWRHVTSPQTCTSYRQCWRVINVKLKWRHVTSPPKCVPYVNAGAESTYTLNDVTWRHHRRARHTVILESISVP